VGLDNAFEEFISHNKTSWKGSSTMENTYRVSYYPVFKSVIKDKKTSDITKADINEFIKLVLNLPANKTKIPKYQKKTFTDFLTMTVPEKDRLSPTTQEKYIRSIGSFLKWMKRNDYSEVELDAPLKNIKFSKTRSNEQRNGFTSTDLAKIFNSDEYIQGSHKQQSHFWVPLIGLYTGARLNEICQLQVKDVYLDKKSNRWVFDINEDKKSDPNKSLKKPFHARQVPVHKKLIELGFVDYVVSQKKQKRLFSDLPFVSSNNKYGDNI
jgi:integrase